MCDVLIRRNLVAISDRSGYVTEKGLAWCKAERIDFNPACGHHVRLCNDWTERVPHFAGRFPCAILNRLVADRCVVRSPIPRALRLTPKGRAFFARLGAQVPY